MDVEKHAIGLRGCSLLKEIDPYQAENRLPTITALMAVTIPPRP